MKGTMMQFLLAWILGFGCLIAASAYAADEAVPDPRAANKAAVSAWSAQCAVDHAGDPDIMLRPGLLANRKSMKVEFFAEATGIQPRETMEFFLIGEESGNAYEALSIALVQPIHIYEAMLFIGMQPGRGINPEKLQFWPKGERVSMSIDGQRAEALMINADTDKPLEPFGLVFTGSQFIPSETGEDSTSLAAQMRPPYSIASNYNEPDSLFDVPFSAPQTAVYSKQMLNPKSVFPEGKRLHVVIEPEYKDGKKRIRDLQLVIAAGSHATPSLASTALALEEKGRRITDEGCTLPEVLGALSSMTDDGYDPFVTIQIEKATTVGQLHKLALLLQVIDGENGIRVEPPMPGQLYYKAFAPNEAYRSREARFLQPWELRLRQTDGVTTGLLTEITEIWTRGEPKPDITTKDHEIASPDALVSVITTRKADVKVLLIYAPPALTHAELMAYVGPAYSTHPIVHVYIEE
jgi:hypothetical protein